MFYVYPSHVTILNAQNSLLLVLHYIVPFNLLRHVYATPSDPKKSVVVYFGSECVLNQSMNISEAVHMSLTELTMDLARGSMPRVHTVINLAFLQLRILRVHRSNC